MDLYSVESRLRGMCLHQFGMSHAAIRNGLAFGPT
jgi:hypothetical protein